MMGGVEIIASFLDAGAIDEFIISVIPTFIGDGIPLIARGHRDVPLGLRFVQQHGLPPRRGRWTSRARWIQRDS
jgi:dihydrofolate reductase